MLSKFYNKNTGTKNVITHVSEPLSLSLKPVNGETDTINTVRQFLHGSGRKS